MEQEVMQFFYTTEENTTAQVRTWKDVDGAVWFVAKDVCEVLEIADTHVACRRLDDDEKLIGKLYLSGQNRDVLLINESGLYSLILTSNKPEAKRFRKWVTSEVLPRLKETGRYEMESKPALTVKRVLSVSKGRGIPQNVIKSAEKILEKNGLTGKYVAMGLDRVFQLYTGYSVLDVVNVEELKELQEKNRVSDVLELIQPLDYGIR